MRCNIDDEEPVFRKLDNGLQRILVLGNTIEVLIRIRVNREAKLGGLPPAQVGKFENQ